jgi:glycerol-3-phosphate dehydrogenase
VKRNLAELAIPVYDLVVIGGGIYGACTAWEAASRGLSVALLEKGDFASATSANSLKIIHGGFRYLQHADFRRMRESVSERKILMQIAPHLVRPLPVLVPTYGHGIKGREALSVALAINDLVSFDRNRQMDPNKHIPHGRMISRQECLQQLQHLESRGLTGGAIFYDAQVYNSERLVLAFLHSAERAGAALANYAEVIAFLRDGERIKGVRVVDRMGGTEFEVQARTVINTSGPWIGQVLGLLAPQSAAGPRFVKAVNLVSSELFTNFALGLAGQNGGHSGYEDESSLVRQSAGLLFVTPWRGYSLIGTTYQAYEGSPEGLRATEHDVRFLLDALNRAYPGAALSREAITYVHAGLLPAARRARPGEVQLAKHYEIRDHRQDGLEGLFSVIGVKYTTARHVAEKTIDRVYESWGYTPSPPVSANIPLYGGHIKRIESYLGNEIQRRSCGLGPGEIQGLVYNYGAAYQDVLRHFETIAAREPISRERSLLRAQILHAVRIEMAQKLADIVFRRTELGTAGHPGHEALDFCARVMGRELGWGESRIGSEIEEVEQAYRLA